MKKIMSANLTTTNTDNEYQWIECNEEEYGREWNGDVLGYVQNLLDDPDNIMDTFEGAIHNLPHGAVIVGYEGLPHSIFWAEDVEDGE